MEYNIGIILYDLSGKVLILKEKNNSSNEWFFPKGNPIDNEPIVDTAIRETYKYSNLYLGLSDNFENKIPGDFKHGYHLIKDKEQTALILFEYLSSIYINLEINNFESKFVSIEDAYSMISITEKKILKTILNY